MLVVCDVCSTLSAVATSGQDGDDARDGHAAGVRGKQGERLARVLAGSVRGRGPERLGYGAGMRTQRWRPRWMVGALAVAAVVVFWCLAARGGGCSDASFDSTCTTSTMGGLPALVGVLIVGTSAVAYCVVRAFRR